MAWISCHFSLILVNVRLYRGFPCLLWQYFVCWWHRVSWQRSTWRWHLRLLHWFFSRWHWWIVVAFCQRYQTWDFLYLTIYLYVWIEIILIIIDSFFVQVRIREDLILMHGRFMSRICLVEIVRDGCWKSLNLLNFISLSKDLSLVGDCLLRALLNPLKIFMIHCFIYYPLLLISTERYLMEISNRNFITILPSCKQILDRAKITYMPLWLTDLHWEICYAAVNHLSGILDSPGPILRIQLYRVNTKVMLRWTSSWISFCLLFPLTEVLDSTHTLSSLVNKYR